MTASRSKRRPQAASNGRRATTSAPKRTEIMQKPRKIHGEWPALLHIPRMSDLDLHTQLHHALGRQAEERRGRAGVAGHEPEQALAPQGHADLPFARDHG